MQETKKHTLSNRLAVIALMGSIILLPIFFLPYVPVALGATKGILFALGAIIAFVFWLVSRLVEGVIVLPKSRIVLAAWFLPIIFLISALFSKSFGNGLWGQGFDVGTVSMMFAGALVVFLGAIYMNKARAVTLFSGLYFTGMIVLILAFLKLFLNPQALSFGGILYGKMSNLVGSWNDLGLFAGLFIILSLIMTEIMRLTRKSKFIITLLGLIPLAILIAVGSITAWVLVGIATLLLFVYSLSFGQLSSESREKSFPVRSFIIILATLFFIVANPMVGNIVPSYLGVSSTEVRPSISSTLSIARHTLARDPILGAGPNSFNESWSLYKPQVINQTQFWNVSFNAGFGFIPTFLVTVGILGALAWLIFIVTFLLNAVRALGKKGGENNGTVVFTSVVVVLYLFASMFVSVPGTLLTALLFVFVGVFAGVTLSERNTVTIPFLDDPRKSFFSILGIVAAVVVIFIVGFGYVKKFSGIVLVSSGINQPNTAVGIQKAERKLVRGAAMSGDDFAYRTLAQFYLIRLGDLLGNTSAAQQESIKPELQGILSKTEASVQAAIAYNPSNFINWLSLGGVYDALVPIGVEKSYENAKAAYEKALTQSPHNPMIYLRLAQLEVANKNVSAARSYVGEALAQKPNYADAYIFLAALEEQSGNKDASIEQLKNAVLAEPSNSGIALRLGIAFYNGGQYSDSVSAFERAVITNQTSLEARYYLGLSYAKVGRTQEAISQLKLVQSVIPDNAELNAALERIQSGLSLDPAPVVEEEVKADKK